MKKILFLIITTTIILSCKEDRIEDTKPADITGNWKISHYEFRGKDYAVKGCDAEDRIIIQKNLQGSYKNSALVGSICDYIENLSGIYNVQYQDRKLVLKYQENNIEKSKTINLAEYSDTSLKISVKDKNIDGVDGADDALEVWVKDL